MSHYSGSSRNVMSTAEPWGQQHVTVPVPARFSMLGRLQLQQQPQDPQAAFDQQPAALDFSARTSLPINRFLDVTTPASGAVDLSKRSQNSFSVDDSSSSSGSSSTDVKPVILPALLQQHVDNVVPSIPAIVTPPFTSLFKKSPSVTRPFKAYPKDPLNLPLGLVGGVTPAETMLNAASNEAYAEFRRQMLAQVSATKTRRINSPTFPTKEDGQLEQQQQQQNQPTQPEEVGSPQQPSSSATDTCVSGKDPAYWERRRKNNEAAKRSRDARRAKEDEIAIRAAFLEQENLKLKYELAALRNETSRLRFFMTVEACKAPEVRVMLLMEFIIQPVPVVNEVRVSLGEYDSEHFGGLGILICNILSAQWGKQHKTTSLLISASHLIGALSLALLSVMAL